MDLQKEFKDLNTNDEANILTDDLPSNLPVDKKIADTDEGDKIIKDLEKRLAEIKTADGTEIENQAALEAAAEEGENLDDENEPTLLEKFQPFILPICLTVFAIIFAGLFLYFFSKSKINNSVAAIQNTGDTQVIRYVDQPVVKQEPIVIPETLTCKDPQVLNDKGDACIDPPVVATSTPVAFEDGTTTVAHVRFSFDKYNYDNYPRGIYLLSDQVFEGDFADQKLFPTNRSFANDHFFGVDRYTVSLIGDCQYVIDDARILVKNMRQGNSRGKDFFTGNVVKVLDSSKPHVVCGK